MNRSILIVICDFLLVSLLAFSSVDPNKLTHPGTASKMQMSFVNTNNNPAAAKQDLGEAMRLALNEEQKNRALLVGELNQTRAAVSNQQSQLTLREQQLQASQDAIRAREEQARQLQLQVAAAQTNMQALNSKLQESVAESVLSREQRAAMEAEARKQAEKANAFQQQLEALQRSNELALAQNRDLANQLQSSEVARSAATAQLLTMQDEVKAQREQNTQLAEGVKALAGKSSELAQEIRANTPLAPNTIFNDVVSNRVEAAFYGVRAGFFGGAATRFKQTTTVLATDGSNVFGVCHVQDTPIVLGTPGTKWEELTCALDHNSVSQPIGSLSFSATDPRVLLMPVTQQAAQQLGAKVYRLSSDPYKFQDAVVVGAKDGYYGECKFEIDLTTPEYFRMDHSSLRGLFGKFNPSSGDLVFSRMGELLGIMANNTYCVRLRNASASAAFELGPQIRNEGTSETISTLYAMVAGLPFKLQ
jgi:membrane protein involved in colicin uptake